MRSGEIARKKTMVKPTIKTISNMVCVFCISTSVLAEDAYELDDMVVTSHLQPISLRDVASSVTIITREEIEQKQVRYLSDLLRDVPGFAVSQAGGAGSQTQVRVRGSEANHLLVLMDGVRANDPAASGEFLYQLALTSDIERIEIIRGPQSATWGSDAVAGVINIIRRKDVSNNYLAGNLEAGSFNTFNAAVNGGYSADNVQVSGGVSFLDTDGTNISRFGNEKDGAKNLSANLTLDVDASEAVDLRFSGQTMDASNDYDDIDYFLTGLPVDADRVTESTQNFLTGEARYDRSGSPFSGSFAVNWMSSDHDNISDGLWSGSTASDTLEYRLRGGIRFGAGQNHRFGFALEHQEVEFEQRGDASYLDPNQDQSYKISGYAIEYIGKPTEEFSWTASARLDDYSDFDNASTWQLAGSYRLSPAWRVRASLGTGSKAPTFTERYGYYPDIFIGNPNLKPESSQGWEIGVDTNWSQGRYHFELAYFDQDLEDEIDSFVYEPVSGLFTAVNKDNDSSRSGVEAVFDANISRFLVLSASYTYTKATENNGMGDSFPEVRRPKNMATVAANFYFQENRGNMNLNVNYVGTQFDVFYDPVTYQAEPVEMDSYIVADLAASWKLTGSLELTARVSNLFNENYEEILGFVRPDRAIYGGIRGRFDF